MTSSRGQTRSGDGGPDGDGDVSEAMLELSSSPPLPSTISHVPRLSTFHTVTSIRGDGNDDSNAASEKRAMVSDARTAQFATLADQQDLKALEEALSFEGVGEGEGGREGTGSMHPSPTKPPPLKQGQGLSFGRQSAPPLSLTLGLPPKPLHTPSPPTNTNTNLASLPGASSTSGGQGGSSRVFEGLPTLTLHERDVLQVLTAFCKLASRDTGLTEVESFLFQGKLLSLELLLKVLLNPQHSWDHVRDVFFRHLRQPLCVALLRNSSPSPSPHLSSPSSQGAGQDPSSASEAFHFSLKLLIAIMLKPRIRSVASVVDTLALPLLSSPLLL